MKDRFDPLKAVLYIGSVFIMVFIIAAGMRWMGSYYDENVRQGSLKNQSENMDQRDDTQNRIPVMDLLGNKDEKKQKKEAEKIAYLTFDDGPSENTDRILDVLKEKGVKATFFVVGKTGQKAEARYKRIVEEGHTLGLHSYSHRYEEIYASLDNYKEDVLKLKKYLYDVTGEDVWLYRFPGGSSNSVSKIPIRECIDFLAEEGIVYFDWNASSEDAVKTNASCSVLNANILKDALRYEHPVILMHDLYECCNTAEALSELIDRLTEEGYAIWPITRETEPVRHVN